MGLQLCPFLFTGYLTTITPRWGTEMAGSTDFRVILRLTLVAIPFLLTIEFLVQQLLWAGIRNAVSRMDRSRRLLQPILLLLFGTLTFVFHLLLASNWYLFYRTGSFYSWESILLSIHALDFAFLAITFGSLSFLGFALAATALLGFTAWLCYGFWSSSVEVRPLLKRLLTLSLVSAMLTLLPPVLFARGSIPAIKNLAHHLLSPNISLIWLPLVAGLDSEPRISKDELATLRLRPQTSIPPQLSQTSPPQNIVILAVEGLRADVLDDCARPEPDFPTLCKLAREGLTFPLAYSNAAETSESLLTIISGQYPLRSPIRESKPRRNPHSDSLFREAQESGYSTAFFGESWSSISMPELSGNLNLEFDPSVDLGVPVPLLSPLKNTLLPRLGYYSLTKADRAKMEGLLRWQATNRIQGKRSFSLLYFYSTHYPYDQYEEVPQKHSPTFVGEDYTWLHYDSHLKPMMWNRYLNTIAYVDQLLAALLESLPNNEENILLLTGDHGQMFNEHGFVSHGNHLYEEAIRVPLIFWGAKRFVKRGSNERVVSHIDVAPSVMNLLGRPESLEHQGSSLLCLASNAPCQDSPLRPIFGSSQAFTHEDVLIEWPWKFSINHWGAGNRLFRLDQDPLEKQNLLSTEIETSQELEACLRKFRRFQISYFDQDQPFQRDYLPPLYGPCRDSRSAK